MTARDNGGSAFPREDYQTDSSGGQQGMTLRDYFAAKGLQGICASGPAIKFTNQRIAKEAYELADAMLKARTV